MRAQTSYRIGLGRYLDMNKLEPTLETHEKSKHFRRVVIHNSNKWKPGRFHYADDIEVLDAELLPTPLPGLVEVRGTQTVYQLAPAPGTTYEHVQYHFLPRFPFIRPEKESMPMQEALDRELVDARYIPGLLKWQKTGSKPFAATLPASKIEARD